MIVLTFVDNTGHIASIGTDAEYIRDYGTADARKLEKLIRREIGMDKEDGRLKAVRREVNSEGNFVD